MSVETVKKSDRGGAFVHANGIDIHYLDVGEGEPLVLLHGGVVSTSALWAHHPFAYTDHMDELAKHFRVIAPDTRGAGLTGPGEGVASFAVLVEDVRSLIDALGLDRPMVGGFSEGGITATLLGISHPDSVRAIVNDAGYDMFNPESPSFMMMRMLLGGSPEATAGDPDAAERFFSASPDMKHTLEIMKADHDAQGEGFWRTYITNAFPRTTQPVGYTFDDLAMVTAPTLVLVGDRDAFCSVEEGVVAYRKLANAELSIAANTEHLLTPAKIGATIDFLERHQGS
jgi:pimeloyl-ACP methyl ester carboxylesterase